MPGRAARTVERDLGEGALLLFHLDGDDQLLGISGVWPTGLGREVRIGQLMLERGLAPAAAALADPATKLKALLRESTR